MSLVICERCGYEAQAAVQPGGGVLVRWPSELGFSACHFARERRAAGETVGKSCPWLEQEIAAAHHSNLLDSD